MVLRPAGSGLPNLVVRAEVLRSVPRFRPQSPAGDSERTGPPALDLSSVFAPGTMLTLRTSPFELFDRLEQQLSQQLHGSERVPSAEVHETQEAYEVVLELPGVDKEAINVRATDRTLVISAERRCQRQRPLAGGEEPAAAAGEQPEVGAAAAGPTALDGQLLSEFHYGTWSRSFRFPAVIDRDNLQARYRDGLLTVTAPKAQKVTTVRVAVEA